MSHNARRALHLVIRVGSGRGAAGSPGWNQSGTYPSAVSQVDKLCRTLSEIGAYASLTSEELS